MGSVTLKEAAEDFIKMKSLKVPPVITNRSFFIPDLLLFFSKLGNSFSNKIKTKRIHGSKRGWPSAIQRIFWAGANAKIWSGIERIYRVGPALQSKLQHATMRFNAPVGHWIILMPV